jgi:hypothetical protein
MTPEEKKVYMKAWRAKNKEKLRAYDKAYRAANKESISEREKQYYAQNKDRYATHAAAWHERHRDAVIQRQVVYREKNKEKIKQLQKNWAMNNQDKIIANIAKRRAAKMQRTPNWLTEEHRKQIEHIYLEAKMREIETGVRHHVDHIIPLQGKLVSGLHVPNNLCVIPATENIRKRNYYQPN